MAACAVTVVDSSSHILLNSSYVLFVFHKSVVGIVYAILLWLDLQLGPDHRNHNLRIQTLTYKGDIVDVSLGDVL